MGDFVNFENISVLRDGRKILNEISLSINSNENTAIIGPNGSGKSTFIKLITRKIYPLFTEKKFSYFLFGKNQWNITELRGMLGIVTNELQYDFFEITGFDTALSGFFSSVGIAKNHKVKKEMLQKTDEMIKFLEVSHLKDRLVGNMSSGEARRFLIARALVNSPKVLLLDEPSNSLDIAASIKLHDTMRKITQLGTKIVLVTHLVSDIIPEMNRFIFFKDGKIFKDGDRKMVFTSENFSQLFGMNLKLEETNEVCEIFLK